MAAFNLAATRANTEDDTVETMAAPIATPQIAQIAPINPFLALRTSEFPRASFAYQFNSPAYAYTTGNFYANAPYVFGTQILRASPLEIRPTAVDIRPATMEIRTSPIELMAPTETPEVAMARAEHLAAVEKEKARIAATSAQLN